MAGRPLGKEHDQRTREKIRNSQIVNRLIDCAMGKVEMTTQQVNAAKSLMNKVLPDLSNVEMDANIEGRLTLLDLLQNAGRKNSD